MAEHQLFRTFTDEQCNLVESEIGLMLPDLHDARVASLSHATLGLMTCGRLAIRAIGRGMAVARGVVGKNAIKQVDRLLGNEGIDPWDLSAALVPAVIAGREKITVALDWTDFAADGQSTLALRLVGDGTGRADALLWMSVWHDELKGSRNDFEDALLRRFAETMPKGTQATVLADRGFGDVAFFAFLENLGFSYVIRFKAGTRVRAESGEIRTAAGWVGKGGRARILRNAAVTAAEAPVPAVVCVHDKAMAEPWCLATNIPDAKPRTIISLYGRRWPIEPSFRDEKDLRFGMGLSETRISDPQRRDRLLLVSALAIHLLVLLGIAAESLGYDRMMQADTRKTRQHSLFHQGAFWYAMVPKLRADRLQALMERFEELLRSKGYLAMLFASRKRGDG